VKHYVKDNPKTTYQKLKHIFTDNLQANRQFQFSDTQTVMVKIKDISEKDKKRFFLNEEDIIYLATQKLLSAENGTGKTFKTLSIKPECLVLVLKCRQYNYSKFN